MSVFTPMFVFAATSHETVHLPSRNFRGASLVTASGTTSVPVPVPLPRTVSSAAGPLQRSAP